MLIGYLTLDEVNLALANELAEECGAVLLAISPMDAPNGLIDATVYDLDHLPPEWRKQILGELLANTALTPLAVHSFNLDEEETEALRNRGVVVLRRLERCLFTELLANMSPVQDSFSAPAGKKAIHGVTP
jgi:hypothetical protein